MTAPVSRPDPGSEQKWGMVPISRSIFDKMMFCDQLFESIELEESLYFTALDVEFHSAVEAALSSEDLLSINMKHFSQMTLNGIQAEQLLPSNPPTLEELNETVSNYLMDDSLSTKKLYLELAEILFGSHSCSPNGKDYFEVDE